MDPTQPSQPFSFAALPAGPPSLDNWYQRLLDDPRCKGNPQKIQEAYQSQRADRLAHYLSAFRQGVSAPKSDLLLREILAHGPSPGASENEDDNCFVVWARPEPHIVELVELIQSRLEFLKGDIYMVPGRDLHLSVLELSHRHSVAHLQAVAARIGQPLLQAMLDVPYQESLEGREARLVSPQVSFDTTGLALTFIPAAAAPDTDGREHFTYHHLRNTLHKLALSSGIDIDTCYTAATAHVAIARFVGDSYFSNEKDPSRMQRFVDAVKSLNKELSAGDWSTCEWSIASEQGLELHLGFVKYGQDKNRAILIGKSHFHPQETRCKEMGGKA